MGKIIKAPKIRGSKVNGLKQKVAMNEGEPREQKNNTQEVSFNYMKGKFK